MDNSSNQRFILAKYNAVQLHFSENEGFRIQSDTLDAIEGFKYKYDDVLSKQDILDIIQVANDYHIEIVPSLDSPGHLGSSLQYSANWLQL